MTPPTSVNLGVLNAFVEAGKDREERAARLATVPDNLRHMVAAHVRCYFNVKSAKSKRP